MLLLETCALIYAVEGAMTLPGAAAMTRAAEEGVEVVVSPWSAWEIGMLAAKGRLALSMNPLRWFERATTGFHIGLAPLTPSLLVAASFLPGVPPGDPADRVIISTARELGLTLLTRDRALLAYGEAGHLKVLPC